MRHVVRAALALSCIIAFSAGTYAQPIQYQDAVTQQDGSIITQPITVTPSKPLPVNASVSASISGFPTSQSTGTPISVTNASTTGTLPAGAVVVATNVGTTNGAYCKLGATATTSDQFIAPNGGWFAFTVGSATQLSCITASSTTTINMVGGSGLPTGTGGGGGSGGAGGGAVYGPTAVGSAAANPPVLLAGTANAGATGNVQVLKVSATGVASVDGSSVTQPVSAASLPLPTGAATAANQTSVIGTLAAGTAATNSQLTGCVYNSTEPSPTTGQGLANQCDSKGRQRQVIMDAAGNTRGANVTASNALVVDGSAVTQPTSHASGSVASGAYASGSIASGAYASGSIASGAFASGAISNGADVVEGNNTDSAACTSGTSLIACTRQIHADAIAAIPAGTNLIGKVGFDQTTPGTTNAVQNISGTTGGVTAFTLTAAASTNATNVKASAGTLYHIAVYNNSATLAWVSFYNTSGTPTCGTSIVYQTMIPANSTSGAGAVEDFATGMNFSSGIGICVTTGIAGTGSVAATSYVVGLGYK